MAGTLWFPFSFVLEGTRERAVASRTTVTREASDRLACHSPSLTRLLNLQTLWGHFATFKTLVARLMRRRKPGPRFGLVCVILAAGGLVSLLALPRELRLELWDSFTDGGVRAALKRLVELLTARCLTYPLQFQPAPSTGEVLDEHRYRVNLCPTCQPERFKHMTTPAAGGFSCKASFLKRCPDCSSRPEGGVLAGELVELEIFLPRKVYLNFSHMRWNKEGYPKRNVHIGFSALLEHESLDARHDAYLHMMPHVTRLQNTRAYEMPYLVRVFCPARLFTWFARPHFPTRACWATRWKEVAGDEEVLEDGSSNDSDLAAVFRISERTEQQIDEVGGLPGRVCATSSGAVTGLGLSGRTPRPTVGDTGRPPDDALLPRSTDGKHAVDVDQTAERIAPVLGNAVLFASKGSSGEANALNAMAERIKDQHATVRKFKYGPSANQKRTAVECCKRICDRWFTKARIQSWMQELGQLQDFLQGKLSEADVRSMVDEMLAGVEVEDRVEAMVKKEVTAKASKPPRLVMDRGLKRFLLCSFASKLVEHGLSELDVECNIKHAPKDQRMDKLTADMSYERLWEEDGHLVGFDKDSTLLVENDFSTYEYTQALEFGSDELGRRCSWNVKGMDEEDMGLLFIERYLIKHVCDQMGMVLNELYPLSNNAILPDDVRVELKPKTKRDPASFYTPNWRLALYLRIRCSGDNQTSWGNRVNQFVPWSIAVLGRKAPVFWHRLIDICTGAADAKKASTWVFPLESGKKVYWRPIGEGDDHLTQLNSGETIGTSWEDTPSLQRVAKVLEDFGLTHNLVLVTEGGRAEFCGCHFIGKRGCLTKGAWVPDMARGLSTSSFATSDALGRASPATCKRTSLAFLSKAVMYKGRCDPQFRYYMDLSAEWEARAAGADDDVAVKLDWGLASFMGRELNEYVTCKEVRQLADSILGPSLSSEVQVQLAEASLGGRISSAEWAKWNSMSVQIDDDPMVVLSALPAVLVQALRKKIG